MPAATVQGRKARQKAEGCSTAVELRSFLLGRTQENSVRSAMFIAIASPPRPSPIGAKCSVSIALLLSFRAFDLGTINIAALRACLFPTTTLNSTPVWGCPPRFRLAERGRKICSPNFWHRCAVVFHCVYRPRKSTPNLSPRTRDEGRGLAREEAHLASRNSSAKDSRI